MHEIDLKDYRAKPPRSGRRLNRSAKRFLGWTQDDYQGTPEDGSARLSSGADVVRVLRGGSWATTARAAYRYAYPPTPAMTTSVFAVPELGRERGQRASRSESPAG